MLTISWVITASVVFLMINMQIKPRIEQVVIGLVFTAPYMYLVNSEFMKYFATAENYLIPVVACVILCLICLKSYLKRRSEEGLWQCTKYSLFMFFYALSLVILLPYLSHLK